MPGATSGNTMRSMVRAGPAPSTAAASSMSRGMAKKKPRSSQVQNGAAKATFTITRALRVSISSTLANAW
jgi:hypothetical protein